MAAPADPDLKMSPPAPHPEVLGLALHVHSDYRYFTTLLFEEPVDVIKLAKLLLTKHVLKSSDECKHSDRGMSHWTKWFDSQHQQLAKLMTAVDKARVSLVVRYKFAHGDNDCYGRVYPEHHLSFGEVSGKLRAFLLGAMWTALDFANCHPNIMHQALVAAGYSQFVALAQYCSDRDRLLQDVMSHYNVDRDAAKNLFIRLLYLGSFDAWARENGLHSARITMFIAAFACEMKSIATIIVKANPEMHAALVPNDRAVAKEKKRGPGRPLKKQKTEDAAGDGEQDEPKASHDQVVSAFCQEHERRLLRHLFDYLVQRGVIVVREFEPIKCMLRYDGIDVLKEDWARVSDRQAFFAEAQQYIAAKSGFQMTLTEKAYMPSPLAEQIEHESDLEKRIPEHAKGELKVGVLITLKEYAVQKAYFEKFVAKIINSSSYAWEQKSVVRQISQAIQMSERELNTSFKHVQSTSLNAEGHVVTAGFLDKWVLDPEMRVCNEVDFYPFCPEKEPDLSAHTGIFNLFRGYCVPRNVKLAHGIKYYTEAFMFIGLNLCENDPLAFQFLWNYLAHLIQRPNQRIDLSMVFQDKPQGVGAGLFFEVIGRQIIGTPYYKNSSNIQDFLGTHAQGIENKLLVVMDEVEFKDSKEYQSRIKDLITCTQTTVNAKHMKPYEVAVFAFMIFLSNLYNAVCLDNNDGERRFCSFKPTLTCKREEGGFTEEDWTYMARILFKSPAFRVALYQALISVDLSEWRPKESREMTLSRAYFEASQQNAPFHAKFFDHYVRELASKETQPPCIFAPPARREWELREAVHLDYIYEVDQGELHRAIHEYASRLKGATAQELHGQRDILLKVYSGVISEKKSGVLKYFFNPRTLWMFLVEKKWIADEGFKYHRAIHAERRAHADEHEVDPWFKELSRANVREVGAKRPV
jgi:hypothetical protein